MVRIPEVKNVVKNGQYELVYKYCSNQMWSECYDELFDAELEVDFPHAPPGFYQHYSPYEFNFFRIWLRNIIISWKLQCEPVIIQTEDPNIIWAVFFSEAKILLGKKECDYQNEHAVRFTINGEKISKIKDYFNPLSFYNAMGITLPVFIFDPEKDGTVTRMPEGRASKFTLKQNRQRAFSNFANPITTDGDSESIYTWDVLEVCPQAPFNMPEAYSGKDFDVQTNWMFVNCPEWYTPDKVPFYQALDPDVIIVESEGYGRTTWSRTDGHYCQRELQIVFLENGKVKHFRVYFNPICKFNSMNLSVPTIPFMNW